MEECTEADLFRDMLESREKRKRWESSSNSKKPRLEEPPVRCRVDTTYRNAVFSRDEPPSLIQFCVRAIVWRGFNNLEARKWLKRCANRELIADYKRTCAIFMIEALKCCCEEHMGKRFELLRLERWIRRGYGRWDPDIDPLSLGAGVDVCGARLAGFGSHRQHGPANYSGSRILEQYSTRIQEILGPHCVVTISHAGESAKNTHRMKIGYGLARSETRAECDDGTANFGVTRYAELFVFCTGCRSRQLLMGGDFIFSHHIARFTAYVYWNPLH